MKKTIKKLGTTGRKAPKRKAVGLRWGRTSDVVVRRYLGTGGRRLWHVQTGDRVSADLCHSDGELLSEIAGNVVSWSVSHHRSVDGRVKTCLSVELEDTEEILSQRIGQMSKPVGVKVRRYR